MEIRIAGPEDNQALLNLETSSSQGEGIQVSYDKKDFFYHDKYFPSTVFIVEDEGKIIGSVGLGIKKYLSNGTTITGAYVHSLRIHSEYQKRPIREFVEVYRAVMQKMKDEGAAFGYGFIKKDNKAANIFAMKRKYSVYSNFRVHIYPLFIKHPKEIVNDPALLQKVNGMEILPEDAQIHELNGVAYTEMDLSPYYQVRIDKAPGYLIEAVRFTLGSEPIRLWEANDRKLNYRILQILNAPTKRAIKDFIKDQKHISFNMGINLLAVINRTSHKITSLLKYDSNMYLHFYDQSTRFAFENMVLDLHDM